MSNGGAVGAGIGFGFLGLASGITAGIFIGMRIRQKRTNAEIDSVKAAYKKAYKEQKEEPKEEKAKEETKEEVASDATHLYDIIPNEKAAELMDSGNIEFIGLPVDKNGHHLYIPDDSLTSIAGMTPKDISEIINSTGDTIYIRNNLTGKYYEIFKSDEPDED